MNVQVFFEKASSTLTYIVYDQASKAAVIIDPVLNFNPETKAISFESFNDLKKFISENNLKVKYVLETHAHADHLSSSFYLKQEFGCKIGISHRIVEVQDVFSKELGVLITEKFDLFFKDGDTLTVGPMSFEVLAAPGHTPACSCFMIEDCIFTGDALFIEDFGTGRCDFPGGSAETMYESLQKLYALPDSTKVYVGHDYQPGGRELRFMTTIGEEKARNVHCKAGTTKEEYVKFRTERDKTLSLPKLLNPSLKVNINAGKVPESF